MFLQESLESDSLPAAPPSLEICPANDIFHDDSFPTPFPAVEIDDGMDFVSRAFNEARMVAEKALGNNTKVSKKKSNAGNAKISKVKKEIQKKVNKEETESCWWSCLKFTSCP